MMILVEPSMALCPVRPSMAVRAAGRMSTGHSPLSALPYVDEEDIDEIISEHIQNGRIVERLRLK